ncbi:hypothetical protein C1I94_03525 [Akkermansia muciniphila]|nr:hypothetical protein CXU06_02720 [Akkermansia muciniphila]QAA40770.1 hypothetical protein C1I94_03525 [Akkermansia muciniphila]QAA43091.1 hypothetical protein C1I96_03415 [Akkermansia muciniphila]HBD69496.1 hypothetical protein [Akkermansia muciniphila]
MVRAFPCEEETGKVRILPGNVPTAETRYRKRRASPLEKKGSSPLPLSSKFWITLIPEKRIQPGKKLSPPFNGI